MTTHRMSARHNRNSLNPKLLLHKPLLRGWIHLAVTPIVLVAVMIAVAIPEGFGQRLSVAIFGVTSVVLFGSSAVYHRGNWAAKINAILRRLDHSNIFLLIAGTYTPLAVLLLARQQATLLLAVIWAGALLGIGLRQFWLSAPRWIYVPIYLALGWVAVWYLPDFYWTGGALVVALIILGGLFYSLGAVVYGLKRPNPLVKVFGFHEIFHLCTVIGWALHFAAILVAI